jgi:hypothetical protein
MTTLAPQELQGLYAVGRQMHLDGPVDVAESFSCQPDITGIVFDQENLNRSLLFPDDIHRFFSMPAMKKHGVKTGAVREVTEMPKMHRPEFFALIRFASAAAA